MEEIELASYLRFHRKRAGLSQRDLGKIVGHLTKDQVSKHERAQSLPSLMSALAYEAVFRVPIAELYPGIYETIRQATEQHLAEIQTRMEQSSAKGREAHAIARTLEWLTERNEQSPQH